MIIGSVNKNPYKGGTTFKRRYAIDEVKPPQIIFYGDSHIARLFYWSTDTSGFGPDDLELKVLGKSAFIYSGGSRWPTVHPRVQGVKIPEHQKQGNTWARALQSIDSGLISPEFVYISCASNDWDLINDRLYDSMRHSHIWHLLVDSPYGPSKFYQRRHNNWWDDRAIEPGRKTHFDVEDFFDKETC